MESILSLRNYFEKKKKRILKDYPVFSCVYIPSNDHFIVNSYSLNSKFIELLGWTPEKLTSSILKKNSMER